MCDFNFDTVAIIPARSGSKRLPGKNMMMLDGKPLIRWTIDAAIDSGCFDKIIVTTDCEKIIAEALNAGVDYSRRDESLAADDTKTIDVVLNVLNEQKLEGYSYRRVMLLQPTSPLRNERSIARAVHLMQEKNAESIISVCEVNHPYEWTGVLSESGGMEDFLSGEYKGMMSQELPKRYLLNGAIYLSYVDGLFKYKSFMLPRSYALVMDKSESVDIDTMDDFLLARFYFSIKEQGLK